MGIAKRGTAQKMKLSIKDFSSKCDQIRSFLRISSYLLGKSLTENFIFCPGGVKIIDVISKKSIVKSVIDLIVFQNLIDLLKLYTSCQALD